ncbi:hypothetical protein LEP1GSC137_3794 [Leptospira borgpetersenii str. Noumea 25]|uniref:Uncharacterized protein n=1 Tax=Leptospira borgpetersenii serovar Ballum TaxID=280505 RepID=A0A0S2IT43_LEPBO|nr:hypothetical protein LBBP_02597 [Leptospira borgpetersenii serovar Ballum]EKR01281.1 hypothetical protein LEP1GSC121_2821 [Leptospira borgpetersenii serovar Castellonis str. 200801910]EMO10764.1 hypothetical protein LEP1GSC137_3794 [Leptospira borgpetersenii str. Noumea 25]
MKKLCVPVFGIGFRTRRMTYVSQPISDRKGRLRFYCKIIFEFTPPYGREEKRDVA